MLSFRPIVFSIGNYNYNLPPQLAHEVVTTLGFGCFLVATLDNVVTTLCFRRRFSNLEITLQQRRDSDVVFLTKI